MSDWMQMSEADAARIRSGGSWICRNGEWVPVSIAAITVQLRQIIPGCLRTLADRLAIESVDDIEDLDLHMSDDLSAVTVTLRGNGHTAVDTFPLASPVLS